MAIELAKEQAGNGDDVRILATGRDGGGADRLLSACEGLQTVFQPGHPLKQASFVRGELADFRPDIAHLHLAPSWLTLALPERRDFGLLAHLHTRPSLQIYSPNAKLRLHFALDKRLLSRCDMLLAVSQWAADAWHRQHAAFSPRVVHNGVRMPEPLTLRDVVTSDRPFTVGIALRLSERKGLDEFLQIAKAVHVRKPDIRFAVAGDGPLAGHYRTMAARMGLEGAVAFHGFVEDISAFWRDVDLGAFTSSVDTFGLSMVEPVSLGRPVVAYRTGTGSDEVIDLCRGVTAVPFGEAEAAAEAVCALRDDPARLARMAEEGRADCEDHFSIAKMSNRVEAIYGEVLASRRAG